MAFGRSSQIDRLLQTLLRRLGGFHGGGAGGPESGGAARPYGASFASLGGRFKLPAALYRLIPRWLAPDPDGPDSDSDVWAGLLVLGLMGMSLVTATVVGVRFALRRFRRR